jgi:hypothetical protein
MLLLPLYPTLQFPKIPRSPQIPSGLCRHTHPQPKHGNLTPRTYPPSLSIPFLPIYITPIIQFENNYLVFILYEVSNSGFKKRGGRSAMFTADPSPRILLTRSAKISIKPQHTNGTACRTRKLVVPRLHRPCNCVLYLKTRRPR